MDRILQMISYGIAVAVVTMAVRLVLIPRKGKDGEVVLSKAIALLGFSSLVISLALAYVWLFVEEGAGVYGAGALVVSLISMALVVSFINCRVTYDAEGFTAGSFFGVKRKYSYADVTAIAENTHETYIYAGGKRIMIYEVSRGGDDFIAVVKEKYKSLHGGAAIPVKNQKNHLLDITHGKVRGAGEIIAGYIIAIVVLSVSLAIMLFLTFVPDSEENTRVRETVFDACAMDGRNIILMSDGMRYKVNSADKMNTDIAVFESICDGKTTVSVYGVLRRSKDYDAEIFLVKALSSNGRYILSFDETNAVKRSDNMPVVVLIAVLLAFALAFLTAALVVGRHPERFGKRIVNIFFNYKY